MNKNVKILLGVIIGIVLIFGYMRFVKAPGVYDTAVSYQEEVSASWGNVESSYQRRADLIPNLVATVKGYAEHEKSTLTAVIEARAKATSVNIDASNLNAQNMQQFQQAQSGLTSALSKLMVVVEKYPDLKANQNFSELQAQLEGTENRINVARNRFNDNVKTYNKFIRGYWKRLFLGWIADEDEFPKMESFKAQEGSEVAPTVQF